MFDKIKDHIKYYLISSDSDLIINRIKDYDVISFDIFDTLIKRDFDNPDQLFIYVAKEYNKRYTNTIDEKDYYHKRITAAGIAKGRKKSACGEEISLDEIYDVINYSDKEKLRLKQIELEVEKRTCHQNASIFAVYKWCVERQKKIIITSDMYLPRIIIEDILNDNGYTEYERLFLSSDLGVKKKSGSLYKTIRKQYEGFKVVHIGDSTQSDYLMAKRYIDGAVLLPRKVFPTTFFKEKKYVGDKKTQYDVLRQFIENNESDNWELYYKYGYECIGPLLYGFCSWLHKSIKESHIDKIFFMSRDGYLMQKSYEIMYPDDKTCYMHISRKSIHFPLYTAIDNFEDFLRLNGNKRWGLEMLCSRLGIDKNEGVRVWKDCGLDEKYTFKADNVPYDEKIMKFVEALDKSIRTEAERQLCATKRYLEKIDFSGDIALVDSGGSYGTSQRCLEMFCELMNIDADLNGFYFWMGSAQDYKMSMYPFKDYNIVGGETIITEFALTSNEGTTAGYEINKDGEAIPVLEEYEYQDSEKLQKIIDNIQEGALLFVRNFKEAQLMDSLNGEVAYGSIKDISTKPLLKEAKMFGDIMFCSDGQKTYLAKPKPLLYYLGHISQLKYDFLITRWGNGFLKRLFIIPLPYSKMLARLRKEYTKYEKQ